MLATLVSAALVCVGALLVGQLVLRLCGAKTWSWLSPAVGLSLLLLVGSAAVHVPGKTLSTGIVIAALVVAGAVSLVQEKDQRPPWRGLLAVLPVVLFALLPFISAWRVGTLGVSLNNDMSSHLLWAQALLDGTSGILPSGYPLAPHSLVAGTSKALGIGVDSSFAGLTIAAPVILGWTALGALAATGLLRSAALALLVSTPFIVASYFGQGAFKEILQTVFALAVVVLLSRPLLGTLWRWIPLTFLLAGSASVYSIQGLLWGVLVISVWLIAKITLNLYEHQSLHQLFDRIRSNFWPLVVATALPAVLLVPQFPRLARFYSDAAATASGSGIEASNLGNLAGRLPIWLASGIWDQPSFRAAALDPLAAGAWAAFVFLLALIGAVWCVRRGQWIIPLAGVIFFLIWVYVDKTQSPYVAAKALVIFSPLVLLLASLPLLDLDLPGLPSPRWWHILAPFLAVVLVFKVGSSSWDALRNSPVGPSAHASELRELAPLIRNRSVLFLGNDDFVRWELAGAEVSAPVIGSAVAAQTRPEKPPVYASAFDFDSVPAEEYDQYDWVLAPRDAAGSSVPTGLKLAGRTRTFDLYKRVGKVAKRSVLDEGAEPGSVLDCTSKAGEALVRRGGTALVRLPPVAAQLPVVGPGGSAFATLPLSAGTWDLVMPYVSPSPLLVRIAGRQFELPPSLDRPGPRLPVGTIAIARGGAVRVRISTVDNAFTPATAVATPNSIVAVKRGTSELVPIRKACGRYVDWYR